MRHLSLAMLTLAVLSARPVLAEDKVNLDPTGVAQPGAVALYMSAERLFSLGQAAKDPMMVLTAARMMAGLTLVPTARLAEPAPMVAADLMLPDAAAMLDAARTLDVAEDLADLISVAGSDVAPQPKALRATASTLEPGASEVWTLDFYGATYAELAIDGHANGNLDLLVTDDKGGQICLDRGSADSAVCGFTPAENGSFLVTVTNSGAATDSYALLTN
ncbi:MAG: hypothetical protein ABI832_18790 [bacterium]